jgi:3-oxoacyl-[acyl-carrier-protein] synthase II
VPRGDGTDGTFNPDDWMEPKEQRKVDEFILYGMAAADQAIKDAGWTPERPRPGAHRRDDRVGHRRAVVHCRHLDHADREGGPRRVSPFFMPGALINLISGQVSIRYGSRGRTTRW